MFGADSAVSSGLSINDDFNVLPENWDAVRLFGAVQTQWRRAIGMGGALTYGLDYTAVKTVMDLMFGVGVDKADVFQRLQIMEQEALGVLNK